MKKTVILSALVAVIVAGTVGCGSDDDTIVTPSTEKPGTKPALKKKKEPTREIKSEFTMPTSGLETVNNGKNLSISKDSSTGDVFISYKHSDLGARVSYYIDIDSDTATGSTSVKGADYLVDSLQSKKNGSWTLSKEFSIPDDTNKSKWKIDTSLDSQIEYNAGSNMDTIRLSPSLLTNGDNFSVVVSLLSENWNHVKTSDKVAFDITLPTDNNVTFSGKDSMKMKVTHDADVIGIELSGADYSKNTEIFINTDDDLNSGYLTTDIWNNLGAEYRIANGNLYHWKSDSTPKDWDYDNIIPLSSVTKNGVVKMSVKKSDIGSPGYIIMGLAIFGNGDSKPATKAIPDINSSFNIDPYSL